MTNIIKLILLSLLISSFNCSFQSKLFNRMNKEKKGENLIISPLSIFQALSLASNGAKGETQSEMLELLETDSIDKLNELNYQIISIINDYKTIDIANAVMTRFSPLKNFSDIAEQYLAPVEPLQSLEQVNNWCSNKTHGKIKSILNYLGPQTLMIILNAVYFKGEWVYQFEEELTTKLPFYNLGETETKVETMTQFENFEYYEDKKVQAIKLPFVEDYMSALIILPTEGNDINKYINTLSNSNDEYTKILKGLKHSQVHLQLPKFEVNFAEQLNDILKDLGMYNAFYGKYADFSGLREEGGLYINKVIHISYLMVNEAGTEAAAVTSISMDGLLPLEEKIYDMKVNRPFLFLLKNSNLPDGYDLVFMAKIEKID